MKSSQSLYPILITMSEFKNIKPPYVEVDTCKYEII